MCVFILSTECGLFVDKYSQHVYEIIHNNVEN